LAKLLARRLGGELISCDSMQVYKGLDIGTNKTPMHERSLPEHLLDLVEPTESFTAADFYRECQAKIAEVIERKCVPILVGGTGFYLQWLLRGRPSAPPTDPLVLEQVDREIKEDLNDWKTSLGRLQAVDSAFAAKLNANDYYRLKRALAVYRQTGQPLSSFKTDQTRQVTPSAQVQWRCFYLYCSDRQYLFERLDRRCEHMIASGLVDEVKNLKQAGRLLAESSPGRAIGYKETLDYLDSGDDREYLERFQAATRQYTRRQECWFTKMPEFIWLDRSAPFSDELLDLQRFAGHIEEIFSNEKDIETAFVKACQEQRAFYLSAEERKKREKLMRTYRPQIQES